MSKKKTTNKTTKKSLAKNKVKTRPAIDIIKEINTSYPKINISPEQYKAWVEHFSNTIIETLLPEIVKMKTAGKKKKIDV